MRSLFSIETHTHIQGDDADCDYFYEDDGKTNTRARCLRGSSYICI